MRLSAFKVIGFSTGGVPNYASAGVARQLKVKKAVTACYHLARRNALAFIAPREILVGGLEEEKRVRRDFSKRVVLIRGSSSDFSQTLVHKQSESNKGVSVFLDTGFPGFLRDELLTGSTEEVKPIEWYPALLRFFSQINSTFNSETVIAMHPKHFGRDHSKFFNTRKTFVGETLNLVANSVLVIATNSTSISYSIVFKKPLFLVTCNAIENSIRRKKLEIRNCGIETGATIFNIDRTYTEQQLRDAMVIDHAKRESYKRKYLTSRTDDKPNYQVLLDEVINATD